MPTPSLASTAEQSSVIIFLAAVLAASWERKVKLLWSGFISRVVIDTNWVESLNDVPAWYQHNQGCFLNNWTATKKLYHGRIFWQNLAGRDFCRISEIWPKPDCGTPLLDISAIILGHQPLPIYIHSWTPHCYYAKCWRDPDVYSTLYSTM